MQKIYSHLSTNNFILNTKELSQLNLACKPPYPCLIFLSEMFTMSFKFISQVIVTCSFLTFSAAIMAGIPVSETVTCPIGGEKFEITRTLSCTTMGRKMSLAPVSSCDFVTHLAQCPTNGLPLYKEFTKQELAQLETYLKTPEFQSIKDKSRFYIAYKIEQFLDGTKKSEEYWILLEGLWFDTSASLKDIRYLNEFRAIAPGGIIELEKKEQPYHWTLMAYIDAITGHKEQAQKQLKKLKNEAKETDQFLKQYITSAIACASGKTQALCNPNTPIPNK